MHLPRKANPTQTLALMLVNQLGSHLDVAGWLDRWLSRPSVHPTVRPSVCPSVRVSAHSLTHSVCESVRLSRSRLSIYLSLCVSMFLFEALPQVVNQLSSGDQLAGLVAAARGSFST